MSRTCSGCDVTFDDEMRIKRSKALLDDHDKCVTKAAELEDYKAWALKSTDDQLSKDCVEKFPWVALEYAAADFLSSGEVDIMSMSAQEYIGKIAKGLSIDYATIYRALVEELQNDGEDSGSSSHGCDRLITALEAEVFAVGISEEEFSGLWDEPDRDSTIGAMITALKIRDVEKSHLPAWNFPSLTAMEVNTQKDAEKAVAVQSEVQKDVSHRDNRVIDDGIASFAHSDRPSEGIPEIPFSVSTPSDSLKASTFDERVIARSALIKFLGTCRTEQKALGQHYLGKLLEGAKEANDQAYIEYAGQQDQEYQARKKPKKVHVDDEKWSKDSSVGKKGQDSGDGKWAKDQGGGKPSPSRPRPGAWSEGKGDKGKGKGRWLPKMGTK